MRPRILLCLFLSGLVPSALLVTGVGQTVDISLVLEGGRKFQKIDGFGANLNPYQWRQEHLKTAFDLLTDDLGGTLFRFDCFGTADWLDPARRDADGHFPEAQLTVSLTGIPDSLKKKPWNFYRTSRTENCLKVDELQAGGGFLRMPLKEKSIFTLTTLSK